MYTKLFKQLEASLAYANFTDADVEKSVKRLLVVADGELNEAGFEENSPIEDAMEDLKNAIDDADQIDEDEDDDVDDDEENEDESEDDDEDEEEVEEDDEEDEDETD